MNLVHVTTSRHPWLWQAGIAVVCMACALALTHAFWRLFQYTPLVLGFAGAIVSSRVGGRNAGFLAVILGTIGYALFPPPLPADGFRRLLLGFVAIAGAFSWLVARRYEFETALRVSQARLTEAQAVAHIGTWQWDITADMLWWSDELYRICGVDRASVPLSYAGFLQRVHSSDRPRIDRAVREAVQEHKPYDVEHRIVRPDGGLRVVHAHGRAVTDEAGQVIRLVGTVQDVTERKVAEHAASRRERQLQTIMNAEPGCVTLVAPNGLLLDMNRSGLEMLGVESLEQIVGRPVIDLIHQEDREGYLQMHRSALSSSLARQEFRLVGLDGREHWVDSRAVAFDASNERDETQRAILNVASNIDERIHTQRALREAEERMLFALEASGLGVWEANLKTGVSYWSETCELMHGLERGAFGGTFAAFIDRIHPEDRESVVNTIDEAIREHGNADVEYRTLWPDGTEHRILSTARFFYDQTGAPLRGAGVSVDVTERRSLEAQLRQSQKMEAIGLLAGGVAHDFNNLLTAIGGYAYMVLRTMDAGDARWDDLQEVAKGTARAAALTRQLLMISRRQLLRPSALDLNGVVADVEKLLHRTIPENIDLRLELSPVLDTVRADRGQLEQVVLNLAINAWEAMPQGGELRFATETVDVDDVWAHGDPTVPPGRYVCLKVSDTGVGMTQQTQARIFEPFFTTKERGKGTGLGLAIVYGIVNQSSGVVRVNSQVGHGTTFEIYLPVAHETAEPPAQVAAAADMGGGSQTILLAEDDGAVRRLARSILTNEGYTVLDARDGDEALAIAQQYPNAIHLLVTDVVMPGISGKDLAARLALERPGVRVLYTSGYADNVMMSSGLEGDLTLLAKPFLPADLLRMVKETLGTAI